MLTFIISTSFIISDANKLHFTDLKPQLTTCICIFSAVRLFLQQACSDPLQLFCFSAHLSVVAAVLSTHKTDLNFSAELHVNSFSTSQLVQTFHGTFSAAKQSCLSSCGQNLDNLFPCSLQTFCFLHISLAKQESKPESPGLTLGVTRLILFLL